MQRGSAAPDPFRPSHKRFPERLNMDDRHIRFVLRKITVHLWKNHRPTYLGELSIVAGVGLERTEMLVNHLSEMGVMRYLTRDEKKAQDIDTRGVVVILLDESLVPHVER